MAPKATATPKKGAVPGKGAQGHTLKPSGTLLGQPRILTIGKDGKLHAVDPAEELIKSMAPESEKEFQRRGGMLIDIELYFQNYKGHQEQVASDCPFTVEYSEQGNPNRKWKAQITTDGAGMVLLRGQRLTTSGNMQIVGRIKIPPITVYPGDPNYPSQGKVADEAMARAGFTQGCTVTTWQVASAIEQVAVQPGTKRIRINVTQKGRRNAVQQSADKGQQQRTNQTSDKTTLSGSVGGQGGAGGVTGGVGLSGSREASTTDATTRSRETTTTVTDDLGPTGPDKILVIGFGTPTAK